MKKKQGFTLIELLAVIIILAILMLIAVPAVLNTLNTAKMNAFKTQTQALWKAAEQQYIIDSMGATGGKACYDHLDSNLRTGGSDSLTFKIQMDTSGKATSITASDTAAGFTASGTSSANVGVNDASVVAITPCVAP